MKTLFLILVFGYTNINAQNYLAYLEKIEFENLNNIKNRPKSSTKKHTKNTVEYMTSKTVRELQKDILDFNLKTETIYDETEKSTYQVVFKNGKSRATVLYNNDGVIFWNNKFLSPPTEVHKTVDRNLKYSLTQNHFDLWLSLWFTTIDSLFQGDLAERAKIAAKKMAQGQFKSIQKVRPETINI